MSKFILSVAAFAATLAAIQKGAKLEDHAALAVGFVGGTVPEFVAAYNLRFASEAVEISVKSISLPPKSNSKAVKTAAEDVAAHNVTHPNAPQALCVKADGTFYLVSLPKKRASKSKAGNGNKASNGSGVSAVTIATECHKADGYTFGGSKNGEYTINGNLIPTNGLMQALRELAPIADATRAKLEYYGKL